MANKFPYSYMNIVIIYIEINYLQSDNPAWLCTDSVQTF